MKQESKSELSNQLRIIGGTHRSRLIKFPNQPELRPTGDRIRETLFNWLQAHVRAASCLDLFAGSGGLGFEALSRGAAWVQFVESSRLAAEAIQDNRERLQFNNAAVSNKPAQLWLQQDAKRDQFDLVFLDPPFADQNIPDLCGALLDSGCLRESCKIYLETPEPVIGDDLPVHWKVFREKKAGNVYCYLFDIAD